MQQKGNRVPDRRGIERSLKLKTTLDNTTLIDTTKRRRTKWIPNQGVGNMTRVTVVGTGLIKGK